MFTELVDCRDDWRVDGDLAVTTSFDPLASAIGASLLAIAKFRVGMIKVRTSMTAGLALGSVGLADGAPQQGQPGVTCG